jgi:hypothetical protein
MPDVSGQDSNMVAPYVMSRRDNMHGNTKRTHLDDSSVGSKVSAMTPATTHEEITLVNQLPVQYVLKVQYDVPNSCGRCATMLRHDQSLSNPSLHA